VPTTFRRYLLASRPVGLVDDTTVVLDADAPVPEPAEGQALVRVRYLSIDPTIRTWMDDAPGYLPPIGIGEVVSSRSPHYQVGDLVFGMTGWQEYVLADEAAAMMTVLPAGVEPALALSVFGVTGMTAYFGLFDIGQPRAGDTVVVSGAAGATGSVVGQLARIADAGTVVGIAGTAEKCAWLTGELGFDHAIDYRQEHVGRRIRELCPDGIDIYFDNVGGEILDACLANLAMRARVVLCGAISQYNEDRAAGPHNYLSLIARRARMEGFLVLDYLDRFPEAQVAMAGWVMDGAIKHREHVVDGLEHSVAALNLLFTGGNTGKVVVRV
jgi:NADPH-dependent curcumin reductase CurA